MNRITIHATIHANAEKVWDTYTLPQHITNWNFASDDWHCPSAENEPVTGGKMKWRMEAKDGSFGFDLEAVYNEVIPKKKIAYTMPDGRKVDVVFEQQADHTEVTITFDPENMHPADFQKAGWQAILNNFKKYAESVTVS